jgi:hypothetical protein
MQLKTWSTSKIKLDECKSSLDGLRGTLIKRGWVGRVRYKVGRIGVEDGWKRCLPVSLVLFFPV